MKDLLTSPEDRCRPSCHLSSLSPPDPFVASLTLPPAAVLSEQFFDPPRNGDKGEAALMRAVLEDALRCFAGQFVARRRHAQRLAGEAEEWFFTDDDRWPFSFVNICAVLGVDPEYVRRGLKQLRRERPVRISLKRQHVVRRSHRLRTAA
jgi:hypothetical protein